MVHLITQFYKVNYNNQPEDLIRKRQNEITQCLKSNLEYQFIEKIHFLYEHESDVEFMVQEGIFKENPKLIISELGHRLTYSDVFQYANQNLSGEVCVYAHSDMMLTEGFEKLTNQNMNPNKIYCLTAHDHKRCSKRFKCDCVRQFVTPKGIYTPTVDGIVFKGGHIKNEVIEKCNHIMHRMGSENRMIAICKYAGYDVICPNILLYAKHIHYVKIFAQQHNTWIELSGECKPLEYYQKIHRQQASLAYDKKIVGGGIPFYDGTAQLVNEF